VFFVVLGSKPISKSNNTAVVSSNGRVVNPFQDSTNNSSSSKSHSSSKHQPPPSHIISVPHSNSDLPNARKMIVLQEYRPPTSGGGGDSSSSKGLHVRRGETVMVLSEEQDWCRVRNEREKEGYVPSVHLVAPYSTMRSRQKFSGGPIRPVASGSSIEVMDHASIHGVVPMYPSRSAGRPRNHSMGDENRVYPRANCNSVSNMHPPAMARVNSPLEVGGGHHHGNMAPPTHPPSTANATSGSTYDQKYSPSTSSGVASFTGTGSPVGHSDESQHSSFCSIEEGGGGRGQEGGMAVEREGAEGAPANGYPNVFHEHSQEMSHLARGRATSEANITYSKHSKATPILSHSRLPVSQSAKESQRPLSAEQHHFEGNGSDTPPPLPPRSYYCNINSHPLPQQNFPPPPMGVENFVPPPPPAEFMMSSQDESDPYAAPVDAIPRNQSPHLGNQSPHLGNPPRGHNAGDARYLRDDIRTTDDHGVYSEVYHGYQRPQHPYRHHNGYHISPNGTEEGMYSLPPSEESSANSQTSRHSGSRISSSRTHYSRDVMSEITPNGDQNGSIGKELPHRPHSGNSENQFGSGQIHKFRKNLWGLYTVIHNFESFDENEVNVVEGDHVSVWNQDDPEWYWIVKHDTNEEGFVPSNCLKEIVSDSQSLAGNKSECSGGGRWWSEFA